jgi:iron-sulfur cluster assembly accessory protein
MLGEASASQEVGSMNIVTLTESAAAKVRELLARDGHEGYALRLLVAGGGCSGLRYQLKFDEHAGELDHESHQFGVRVLIDPGSAKRVAGACIDFTDELNRAGFQIQNPSAATTCGCGESFSV